jgi:citronellol/citronellal dehydrogenase
VAGTIDQRQTSGKHAPQWRCLGKATMRKLVVGCLCYRFTMTETFAPKLFAGQRIAITGGGTGIGLHTATRFAQLGAHVSICGRRAEVLVEACAAIDAAAQHAGFGTRAHHHRCDVKQPEQIAGWRDDALVHLGGIDCLVVNAGANFLAPAAAITPNGFATVVGTILMGSWNTVHAWFPSLQQSAMPSIVFMAATNGATASPLMAHSGAGKAGLLNLTQTLAVEWASFGIRVNAVAPGPVDTQGANDRLWADEEARRRLVARVPLGRLGTAADCADAVLYLSSPAARFITGSTLTIDGGNCLKPLPPLL